MTLYSPANGLEFLFLPPSCSGYFTYHSLPSEHGLRTGWWAGLRRSRLGCRLTEQANPFWQALLVDGIIGGVGAVVGFLPLVMVMYFLIALLEDCGYMARATVVLDPLFKRVGLSGKSVIPMVIGTGCAIPGIMACRTIRNERERRATAMLTPFMPCGAKLPVIAYLPERSLQTLPGLDRPCIWLAFC